MAVVPTSPDLTSNPARNPTQNPTGPSPDLPRRDDEARARLRAVAAQARPFVAAGERRLEITGLLGEMLPAGLQRGSTIAVNGPPGSGATTLTLTIAAAATAAGEWAAVVDPRSGGVTLGARAAAGAGVELERLAVVRGVAPDRWASVVAALLDGITVVIAAVPPHLRLGDARRLVARARERKAVLVAFGVWPVEAAVRVHAGHCTWSGLGAGTGLLNTRDLHVEVEGKGRPQGRTRRFARAG